MIYASYSAATYFAESNSPGWQNQPNQWYSAYLRHRKYRFPLALRYGVPNTTVYPIHD